MRNAWLFAFCAASVSSKNAMWIFLIMAFNFKQRNCYCAIIITADKKDNDDFAGNSGLIQRGVNMPFM
jgi:hypothetical protein